MLLLVFLAATTSAIVVDPVDVMANIRAGHQLCSNPDLAAKTCSTLTTYSVEDDGSVVERVETLLAPTAPITLEMQGVLTVEGQKTCGTFRADALDAVIFRVNGQPASPDEIASIQPLVRAALTPMIGRKACDEFHLVEGILTKQGSVEGLDVAVPPRPVAWVTKDQKYSVAPKG